MGFTAEEQAILCELSYIDIESDSSKPKTLRDVLTEYEETLREELGEGYDEILDGLMEKVEGEDYKIVATVDDDANTGFVALAIEQPGNEVTVVCRGSEDLSQVLSNKDSQKDLDTDLQIGTQIETDQQQKMEEFVDYLEARGYDGYYFTGHSLGGNLAIHGAVSVGDPSKVKGVTTYNSPGFNDKYWTIYGIRMKQIEGKVTNYANEYDIVSSIFTKPGTTVYVDSYNPDALNHSICDFRIREGGFQTTSGSGKRRWVTYALTNGAVDYFWDRNILQQYIVAKATGGALTGYRDFSTAALELMVGAAKETEEEDWWDVTRWDCWYRLDKSLFGGLIMDVQLLAGNVDTYYRKIIDMNDASVKDVQNIFRKVYEVDSTYAGKLRSGTAQLNSQVIGKLKEISASVNPGVG